MTRRTSPTREPSRSATTGSSSRATSSRASSAIVERHEANGELFDAHFASDERRDLVDEFLVRSLYDDIRGGRAF